MPAIIRAALGAALAIALFVGAATPGVAQDRKIPVAQQPMYGTAPRDSQPVKADEQLLQAMLDKGISRKRILEDAIDGGWQAFRAGEPGLAIRRFNLAWLLDPENAYVYWGFSSAIQARDGNLERAADFMARARSLKPDDAALMADSASLMLRMGRFDKAIDLYKTAQSLQPRFGAADKGLAFSYAAKGDYRRARGYAERAEEKGEKMPEPFMEELRSKTQ